LIARKNTAVTLALNKPTRKAAPHSSFPFPTFFTSFANNTSGTNTLGYKEQKIVERFFQLLATPKKQTLKKLIPFTSTVTNKDGAYHASWFPTAPVALG
jgi:hypothetical protein